MAIIQHSHISLPRSVELNWHALHQGWLADFRFSSISFLCVSFRLWYLAVSFMGLLGLFPLLPASGNFCLLWSFSIWPQQVSSFSFPSLLTVLAWLVWSGPWSCCSSASIWNLSYIFTKKTFLYSLMFTGLLINRETVPVAFQWLHTISFFHAAFEALAVNELRYLQLKEVKYGVELDVPAATILSTFGLRAQVSSMMDQLLWSWCSYLLPSHSGGRISRCLVSFSSFSLLWVMSGCISSWKRGGRTLKLCFHRPFEEIL